MVSYQLFSVIFEELPKMTVHPRRTSSLKKLVFPGGWCEKISLDFRFQMLSPGYQYQFVLSFENLVIISFYIFIADIDMLSVNLVPFILKFKIG